MDKVRRLLELAAAITYSLVVYFYFNCLVILLFIVFTDYWPIVPLLILWTFYDRETPFKGGRRLKILTSLPIWKYLNDYFPIRLHKTADISAEKNYIFMNHPHGILNTGMYCNFMIDTLPRDELFPGLTFFVAGLNLNFFYPLLREITMGLRLVSCSKRSFRYLLDESRKGQVINLSVGGADEVKYCKPGDYNIILNRTKGFIKLALTLGCGLVPVFHFGENNIYDLSPLPGTLGKWLSGQIARLTGFQTCLPTGRSWPFKFVPRRSPINTVVGKPMDIPKIAEPTQEQIDHYHSLYKEELMRLFEEYKYKFEPDPDNNHLIIAE